MATELVKVKYIGDEDRKNVFGTWKPGEVKKVTPEQAKDLLKVARLFEPTEVVEKMASEDGGGDDIIIVPEDHEYNELSVPQLKEIIREFKVVPGRKSRKTELVQQAYELLVKSGDTE